MIILSPLNQQQILKLLVNQLLYAEEWAILVVWSVCGWIVALLMSAWNILFKNSAPRIKNI